MIDYIGSSDGYDNYQKYFRKIDGLQVARVDFETSLSHHSDIVLLDSDLVTRSAYALMLMEQGKDVLITYPMGMDLDDYASISEFIHRYGRILGMMNPLVHYPSVQILKKIIAGQGIAIKNVRLNCHPNHLGGSFAVGGLTGSAQAFQGIITQITGKYILKVEARSSDYAKLDSIRMIYDGLETLIFFDSGQLGWNMELTGENFSAMADHTGLLALRDEVEPRITPDTSTMENAIRRNVEDYLQAVRDRSEPLVNHLAGLASIMLNMAVEESIQTGYPVSM